MQQRSDYVVLALIVLSTAITTALGAHVAGFDLPPAAIFGLLVVSTPITVTLAVLPQLGIRVPRTPTGVTIVATPETPA